MKYAHPYGCLDIHEARTIAAVVIAADDAERGDG